MSLINIKQRFLTRAAFIKLFLERLQEAKAKVCLIRGQEHLFLAKNKDVDLLVSPDSYALSDEIFKELCLEYGATFVSSHVSSKNLYMKALLVTKEGEIEGVYLHLTAYITVKTEYKNRDRKYLGTKIWIDSFNLSHVSLDGFDVPIPPVKVQVLFHLAKYTASKKLSSIQKARDLLTENDLIDWAPKTGGCTVLEHIDVIENEGGLSPKYFETLHEIARPYRSASKSKLKQYFTLLKINLRGLFRSNGRLIFFSGPDGAGKTTANKLLATTLNDKLKVPTVQLKHLYPISNRTSVKAQKLARKIRNIEVWDTEGLERDRGRGFIWRSRRRLGLIYILMQIWPGYLVARYKNLFGKTVIIDTAFYDAFVKGHRPNFPILQRLFVPLIPPGDYWFLMVSDAQCIVDRKPELTTDEIIDYYQKMELIARIAKVEPIRIRSDSGVEKTLQYLIENY